jgi:hypothetical protein
MISFDSLGTLGTAAVFGIGAAVATFWSQIRNFVRNFLTLLIERHQVSDMLAQPLTTYVIQHYKKMPVNKHRYDAIELTRKGMSVASLIPFEVNSRETVIIRGPEGIFAAGMGDGSSLQFSTIRGLGDFKKLVINAMREHDERRQSMSTKSKNKKRISGYYVNRIVGTAGETMASAFREMEARPKTQNQDSPEFSSNDSYSEPWLRVDRIAHRSFMYAPEEYQYNAETQDPLKGLYYPKQVHDLIDRLRKWYDSRDWYIERGIPWKTGVLFHGPGGTGKSSLAKVIGQVLDVPVYQFYLNTLTDKEFVKEWDAMPVPCVVALEDIDTVFHGREAATIHKSLSFECVLNQISGITSHNGVLLVVTTNNIDHLDPALGKPSPNGSSTRPGRIDHTLFLGYIARTERQQMAENILKELYNEQELVEIIYESPDEMTAAQFQALCISKAYERISL